MILNKESASPSSRFEKFMNFRAGGTFPIHVSWSLMIPVGCFWSKSSIKSLSEAPSVDSQRKTYMWPLLLKTRFLEVQL